MGKHVKIKLKNQKNSAEKKRAAFSITAYMDREGTEAYRAQERIPTLRFICSPLLPGKFKIIIASKNGESIGTAYKNNIYTMLSMVIQKCALLFPLLTQQKELKYNDCIPDNR